ncbi:MAG: methionine aminotransferase [Bacteroidetes bacterium]|nr:methionine aminotransferase [Bacteroidota bacterium]HET6245405.1 methionine aminotransferase [Bacteroidia bacterium]
MPEYSGNISSKLPKVGASIFSVMSKLAQEHNAINLSQGFPDFDCSPELLSLANKYFNKGINQYAPMAGILPLREAIAKKTEDLYGTLYDPETEITVTSGATQAIYTAITATIKENDEVIIFGPAYDCYQPAVELNGGKPVYVKLNSLDFSINWEAVKKVINNRTRMIIINSPHNPTGNVLTEKDMLSLENIVKNTNIIILSDEVYEHIIFDGKKHLSVCKYPSLNERSFIISSFGKTYHTTGWKIGYCLAPEKLMSEFRKVHQYIVFSCNTPLQYAFTDYLANKEAYTGLGAFYQQKRDHFNSLIKDSRFSLIPSSGTYFQLLDYKKITDKKDTDFAITLIKEHGVASVPVSVFYGTPVDNKVLRFCFAKNNETLEKAAKILCTI